MTLSSRKRCAARPGLLLSAAFSRINKSSMSCCRSAMRFSAIVRPEHVAGNLPADELVIRHVGIEGLDHEVAIFPSAGTELIALEALTFAIANDVQPVTCPALAVVRRIEESIDQAFVGIGRGVA